MGPYVDPPRPENGALTRCVMSGMKLGCLQYPPASGKVVPFNGFIRPVMAMKARF